jgi:putative glutamine amidotransferase
MRAEMLPMMIPVIPIGPILEQYLRRLDGLLLIGGPDLDPVHYHQKPLPGLRRVTPPRDSVELRVTRWALEAGLPILAICRGIQVLNVAAGGTLWQDIATQRPEAAKHDYHPGYPENHLAHSVQALPDSRLAGIVGKEPFWVNSLHHQAIDRLGDGLRPTAYAPDGIVEAVEGNREAWMLGVQWHPEWLVDSDDRMLALFQTFSRVCAGDRRGAAARM